METGYTGTKSLLELGKRITEQKRFSPLGVIWIRLPIIHFYKIETVLVPGRVTSGEGGMIILNEAKNP